MKIRTAELADVPEMVALGRAMVEESLTYRHLQYDPARVAAHLRAWINEPSCICLVVETENGDVVGGFCGQVFPNWFSNDIIAGDHVWFMHPDYRGTISSLKLLKEYKERAFALGAKHVTLGNSTGVMAERVAEAVERMGFTRIGYGFGAKEE